MPASSIAGLAHGTSSIDHRQGPHRAHRHQRGAARRRRDRRAHAREPAAHGGQRSGLQGRRGAGRLAVPAALRRQDHVQRPADRAGGRRNVGDRALCGVAGPGGIRQGSARHGHVSPARRGRPDRRLPQIRWRPCSRRRSRAARPTRRWLRPRCATRPSITSRSSITTRWSSTPRRWSSRQAASSRSTTRPRACRTCSSYLCGVFGMKPEDVRVMSPYHGRRLRLGPAPAVSGGAGRAGGARAAALGARRADAAADVCAGLPARDDPAHRARRKRRRNARCDHARCGHGDLAIRGLPSAGDRLVRPALQVRPTRNTRTGSRGSISPTSCDMRAPSAATGVFALESRDGRACGRAQARSARASPAVLFGPRPARGQALQQQGAARMLPPGRGGVRLGQAQPRAALDARRQRSGRLGHGDRRLGSAAGADHGAHRAHRQRPCRGGVRDLRHRHRHLHHHGAGRGRHAGPAARQHQHQARRLDPAAIAGRRRIVDRGLGGERHRDDGRGDPRRAAAPGQADAEFAARERRGWATSRWRTASW